MSRWLRVLLKSAEIDGSWEPYLYQRSRLGRQKTVMPQSIKTSSRGQKQVRFWSSPHDTTSPMRRFARTSRLSAPYLSKTIKRQDWTIQLEVLDIIELDVISEPAGICVTTSPQL